MGRESQQSVSGNELTETERAVAALWHEVLQSSHLFKPTDDFFALGGDSIGMVTVLFRIGEELSVELPPEAILSAPSLRELSALVDAVARGGREA